MTYLFPNKPFLFNNTITLLFISFKFTNIWFQHFYKHHYILLIPISTYILSLPYGTIMSLQIINTRNFWKTPSSVVVPWNLNSSALVYFFSTEQLIFPTSPFQFLEIPGKCVFLKIWDQIWFHSLSLFFFQQERMKYEKQKNVEMLF